MIKLGVLWKKTSKQGNRPYLAGPFCEENVDDALACLRNGGRFLVLPNRNKRDGKKDPDCDLLVVPKRSDGDG